MSNKLDFIAERIEQAKQSAEASKKADDTCSQHGRFVDLHLLSLDISHLSLKESSETKEMMESFLSKVTPVEIAQPPQKTVKDISFSLKKGLHLQGYGAWAAVMIIAVMAIFVVIIGGFAIAEGM